MPSSSSSPQQVTSQALRDWMNQTITTATCRHRTTSLSAIKQALRDEFGTFDLSAARGWKSDRPVRKVPRSAIAIIARICHAEPESGLRLWDEAASPGTGGSLVAPDRLLQGRANEMDECRKVLAAARSYRTAVLAIAVGEQGIGKTELTRHLAFEASEAGFEVLVTSERPGIAALEEAVGIPVRTGEDLRLLRGDEARGELDTDRIGALRDALLGRAAIRPLLLVAEDLHDSYSSELLAIREVTRIRAPIAVLCTTRPYSPTTRHAEVLRTLEESASKIALGLLTATAVAAMVEVAARAMPARERGLVAQKLFALTRGHAFGATRLLKDQLLDGMWREGKDLGTLQEAGQLTVVELERQRVALTSRLPPGPPCKRRRRSARRSTSHFSASSRR